MNRLIKSGAIALFSALLCANAAADPKEKKRQSGPSRVYEINANLNELVSDPATRAFAKNAINNAGIASGKEDLVLLRFIEKAGPSIATQGFPNEQNLSGTNLKDGELAAPK